MVTLEKSKTPYFDCLVQTSNASKVRAVCYETKKRTTLHQAYSSKSPVKISGVKRLPTTSFSESLEEYKIAKMAKISPTVTEFDFSLGPFRHGLRSSWLWRLASPQLRELCIFHFFLYFVFVLVVFLLLRGASATVCGLWRFLSPHVDNIGWQVKIIRSLLSLSYNWIN